MTARTTGYEFKMFINDDDYWYKTSKNTYYDDPEITVNGDVFEEYLNDIDTIEDKAVVGIHSGIVVFDDSETVSLESFFRKWKKLKSTTSFIVECNNSKTEKIVEAIKSLGGKIK